MHFRLKTPLINWSLQISELIQVMGTTVRTKGFPFIFHDQFMLRFSFNETIPLYNIEHIIIIGDVDEFYDGPREFHILGSCLFHRGLLVSTHLPKMDTVDVLLWLKTNGNILAMSSKHPVRRIVAWKEIYPTRHHKQRAK